MKIVTGNRLSDGRVIYLGRAGDAVESLSDAALFEPETAEAALAVAAARPAVFVGAYLVEVTGHTPSGRDRLKETIRSAGPTVGNSLKYESA
ncbi:hypothetical protein BH09PSE1_BH09PSE1_13000 [soil metagenome]